MKDEARAARRTARRGGPFVTPRGQVVRATVLGRPVFFTVTNPRDEIQRHHLSGQFYEPEELAIIARAFPIGGRMLDIGANVGNHTLYAALFLHAQRVVAIEPNPPAIAVLRSNVALNGLGGVVDLTHVGTGLSDAPGSAAMRVPARNLGGSRMLPGAGDVALARGDVLLAGQAFDLVKIDVEGMELAVLAGLEGVLAACRPAIFVEVEMANLAAVEGWAAAAGYGVTERFQRYPRNINLMLRPVAGGGP